jgi:hypothetical protein
MSGHVIITKAFLIAKIQKNLFRRRISHFFRQKVFNEAILFFRMNKGKQKTSLASRQAHSFL